MPGNGPLTWTVPGRRRCLDRTAGTLSARWSWPTCWRPSIDYARNGFPVSEIIQGQWASSTPSLREWPTSAATYLPNGQPPAVGESFKNPQLADTYEQIAQGGRDAFYRGEIARKIVAFSEANGGYFTMADFEDHTSAWVEPVGTNYRGYDIWEVPPNSSGILALMILNIMEGYDIASPRPQQRGGDSPLHRGEEAGLGGPQHLCGGRGTRMRCRRGSSSRSRTRRRAAA